MSFWISEFVLYLKIDGLPSTITAVVTGPLLDVAYSMKRQAETRETTNAIKPIPRDNNDDNSEDDCKVQICNHAYVNDWFCLYKEIDFMYF